MNVTLDHYQDLRRFVEYAPVAIAMLDANMRYVAASGRWRTDFGLGDADLRGQSHYDVFPEISTQWKAIHHRCLAGAAESSEEDLFVRADGSHQWIRWAIQPWRTAAGSVGGLIIFSEDITARKQAELGLRQNRDALEEQTRELQRRATQLFHLASELTLVEQHAREQLAKTLHDHLQQLLFSATLKLERLAKRMNQSAEAQLVDRAKHDIDEAISASRSLAVELFPPVLHNSGLPAALSWLREWMEQTYGLAIELSVDPEATPERKDMRTLVFESVRELLFNVVKHAEVDRVAVDLALRPDDMIEITVADKGKGLDPAVIFRQTPGQRVGLGLISIRERLALLGGRLEVESAPGLGTRFIVCAPRRSDDPDRLVASSTRE